MKMSYKLELKEWKDLERYSTDGLNNCKVQMCIHEIMLSNAVKKIHDLGGETLEEEDAKLKKEINNYNEHTA